MAAKRGRIQRGAGTSVETATQRLENRARNPRRRFMAPTARADLRLTRAAEAAPEPATKAEEAAAKVAQAAQRRKPRALMTPEELEAVRVDERIRKAKSRVKQTPEQHLAELARNAAFRRD